MSFKASAASKGQILARKRRPREISRKRQVGGAQRLNVGCLEFAASPVLYVGFAFLSIEIVGEQAAPA